jgi:NAD(P)-dependent dehydrogenase (short-subunit alcohol dehydrogenase family)
VAIINGAFDMTKRISEQVVVIIGASSGIGLACARDFASRGASVVIAARNASDIEREAREMRNAGGHAIAVPCDASLYDQVQHVAERAVAEFGRIDTWIHSAAVSLYGTFKQASIEDFRRIIEINFLGQVYGAKAALPHLERSRGALICIGSALSDRGVPLQSAYCASKHAIKGWLDSLRVELKQEGSPVRVTLVKPSSINTPLFRKAKTLMGVEPQPIPPVYDVELAVDAIRFAAESDVRDIFVGGAGKFLSVAERISPALVDWHLRLNGFDAQKTAWRKNAGGENNLNGPLDFDGGAHGDFVLHSKDRSAYQNLETARAAKTAIAACCAAAAAIAILRRGSRTAHAESA